MVLYTVGVHSCSYIHPMYIMSHNLFIIVAIHYTFAEILF